MAIRKRKPWTFEKVVKHLPEWFDDARDTVLEINEADVHRFMRVGSFDDWGSTMVRLGPLSAWHGSLGLLELHERGAQGWVEIAGACDYLYWSQRIAASYPDRPKPRPEPLFMALVLAHSLATQLHGRAKWAGELLLASASDLSLLFSTWDYFPVIGFMARLYAKYRDRPLDCSRQTMPSEPCYESLLNAWDDPTALESAIVACCDYHVTHTNANNDYHDFWKSPYEAYAPEILAIYRVREELGLETPVVEHPLLQCPLAFPPDPFPEYHDELLDMVIARYREQFGD